VKRPAEPGYGSSPGRLTPPVTGSGSVDYFGVGSRLCLTDRRTFDANALGYSGQRDGWAGEMKTQWGW